MPQNWGYTITNNRKWQSPRRRMIKGVRHKEGRGHKRIPHQSKFRRKTCQMKCNRKGRRRKKMCRSQRQSKKCNKKQRNDERRLKRTNECKQRTLMRLKRQQRNKTRYVSLICDFLFFNVENLLSPSGRCYLSKVQKLKN